MHIKGHWRHAASVVAMTVAFAGFGIAPIGAQDGEVAGEIRFSWWGGQLRNEKTDRILQL